MKITKDSTGRLFKECKAYIKLGDVKEALRILDKLIRSQMFSASHPPTKMVCQFALLCSQLPKSVPHRLSYLEKAENALINWVFN